jgi:hypothetical protein
VVTHYIFLLLLHFVHVGGHDSFLVIFGVNATEVANLSILLMSPLVYHDYIKDVVWLFW